MDQLSNYKHKIDSNDMSLIQPIQSTQTIVKSKYKKKKCNECNKRRKRLDESHQICHVCYKIKALYNPKQSGNKVIDDFIRHTQINRVDKKGKMEFVPYDQFKNVEFIAEGGFSKIYKATWINGPVTSYNKNIRHPNYTVVLKKLNNSENITSKELNELKIFYDYSLKWKIQDQFKYNNHSYEIYNRISEYFGITQDPITKDVMIIMPYYREGDLVQYITKDFYDKTWYIKMRNIKNIINGLANIHDAKIIHRDLHSGNIFFRDTYNAVIGDLGISKSATTDNNNNENYGIIPYMAPEFFQEQKYNIASDIYSFGMIMWELMTGRRPFWDRNHDIELIIKICDGERPPIVTNAPEGYIELMKECWHSDPEKRPSAINAYNKIKKIYEEESKRHYEENTTKIIESPDIGPVTNNNPDAIYKSRPLSRMINSAMSIRSSRSQSNNLEIDPFYYYQKTNMTFNTDKRKLEDDLIEDNRNYNDQNVKRRKLYENENNDYHTKEIELDIDILQNNAMEYITKEIDLDIIL